MEGSGADIAIGGVNRRKGRFRSQVLHMEGNGDVRDREATGSQGQEKDTVGSASCHLAV